MCKRRDCVLGLIGVVYLFWVSLSFEGGLTHPDEVKLKRGQGYEVKSTHG